jgi:hypothetical protein
MLNVPLRTSINLDEHRVAAVAQRWGALYASWLED